MDQVCSDDIDCKCNSLQSAVLTYERRSCDVRRHSAITHFWQVSPDSPSLFSAHFNFFREVPERLMFHSIELLPLSLSQGFKQNSDSSPGGFDITEDTFPLLFPDNVDRALGSEQHIKHVPFVFSQDVNWGCTIKQGCNNLCVQTKQYNCVNLGLYFAFYVTIFWKLVPLPCFFLDMWVRSSVWWSWSLWSFVLLI